MSQTTNRVPISLVLKEPPPASIDAGTPFSLSLSVEWPLGLETVGATYEFRSGGTTHQVGPLAPKREDGLVSVHLTAPEDIGEHHCVLAVFAPAPREAQQRAEGQITFVLTTIPHATSLAVWDVPSPVVRGAIFEVKVGGKCSAACNLVGRVVQISTEDGKTVGSAVLGTTPWQGTSSLYWTAIQLKAPRRLKIHSWSVHLPPSELRVAHGATQSRFSFATVAEPEHSVSVKVVNKQTKAPIPEAQIRLGLYRALTDAKGIAKVKVPKGEFALVVTRAGFDIPDRLIHVAEDVQVRIPAEKLPEEDPFAAWTA